MMQELRVEAHALGKAYCLRGNATGRLAQALRIRCRRLHAGGFHCRWNSKRPRAYSLDRRGNSASRCR